MLQSVKIYQGIHCCGVSVYKTQHAWMPPCFVDIVTVYLIGERSSVQTLLVLCHES